MWYFVGGWQIHLIIFIAIWILPIYPFFGYHNRIYYAKYEQVTSVAFIVRGKLNVPVQLLQLIHEPGPASTTLRQDITSSLRHQEGLFKLE
jgi:hypothetical protein